MNAHALMVAHARTFSAAAAWLAPNARREIETVYAFCRVVDDLADETADGEALSAIHDELWGRAAPSAVTAPVLALRNRGVPMQAAIQLVDGVRADLGSVRVPDVASLLRYAYRVAGTVGLLTAPLFGVRDPAALAHAVDLGIAMQLTNIARDVGEDAARGRIYLPASWLSEAGLTERDVFEGTNDEGVASVVRRLLMLAEDYYTSGNHGLPYLPFRARLAVTLAARRYRAIGRRVGRLGRRAIRTRTVLGPVARGVLMVGAAAEAVWLGLAGRQPHRDELHGPVADLVACGSRP